MSTPITAEVGAGIPPVLTIDPGTQLCAGLQFETDKGQHGTIYRVQATEEHYYVGVTWADPEHAPGACIVDDVWMPHDTFMVEGPRP